MSDEAKCKCQFCDQHIAFPLEMAGQMFACPNCGSETKLFIPQTTDAPRPAAPTDPVTPQPTIEKPDESSITAWSYVLCFIIPIAGFFFGVYLMAKKKSGHGAACMAISIVLGLVWLALFSTSGFTLFDKQKSILENYLSADAHQKPDDNLRPVQGAYGWNLGDVLPNSFEAKTNDDSLGITCDFNPSPTASMGWLTLTADRRIAAIYVAGFINVQGSVNQALKEKYGFRKMAHYSSGGDYNCYFGTTNRQAVLNSFENVASLEYRDEELCRIADEQKENRKAAAQKKINDELKTHL